MGDWILGTVVCLGTQAPGYWCILGPGTQVRRYTGTQINPVKIVCESSSKPENFNEALFSPPKKSFSLDS